MRETSRLAVILSVAFAGATLLAAAQPAHASGHELRVRVFHEGTWSAGKGDWVAGAAVKVAPHVGAEKTDRAGTAIFKDVEASRPGKRYDISVSKKGCKDASREFKMGAYDQVVNIELTCKTPF